MSVGLLEDSTRTYSNVVLIGDKNKFSGLCVSQSVVSRRGRILVVTCGLNNMERERAENVVGASTFRKTTAVTSIM